MTTDDQLVDEELLNLLEAGAQMATDDQHEDEDLLNLLEGEAHMTFDDQLVDEERSLVENDGEDQPLSDDENGKDEPDEELPAAIEEAIDADAGVPALSPEAEEAAALEEAAEEAAEAEDVNEKAAGKAARKSAKKQKAYEEAAEWLTEAIRTLGDSVKMNGKDAKAAARDASDSLYWLYCKWLKSVKGCQIEYSQNIDFSDSKKEKIKKSKDFNKLLKKLKAGKKYYMRVRLYAEAEKKKYYSAWSKVMIMKP